MDDEDGSKSFEGMLHDTKRIQYYQEYLTSVLGAIRYLSFQAYPLDWHHLWWIALTHAWILLIKFSFTEKEQMYGATLLGHYWTILSGLSDIQNDLDSFTLTTRMVKSDMWRTQRGGTHNSSTKHMEAQAFEVKNTRDLLQGLESL